MKSQMRKWSSLLALLALPFASGCALFGGVQVESVATSVQKPSNVAIYMSVSKDDEPIRSLTEKDFHIKEDGQELAPDQTKQVLLPRDVAAVHRALLLVDMSGPVKEGDARNTISLAVARFVTRAHATQPVTVYAFDGGAAIRLIGEFPEGTDAIGDIPALTSYEPQDPSSNLNGAIPEALAQLDARLAVQKPIRVGTFVVFARGPDLAGRIQESKASDALSEHKFVKYAIAVKDAPSFHASRLGRDGVFEAESAASLLTAFDDAGARVASTVERYFLLSYCSPARAGKRRLRVEVVTKDAEGKESSGGFATSFDSDGFTSGCDPTQRPRFVPPKEPPKTKDEGDDSKKAEEKKTDEKKPSAPRTDGPRAPASSGGDDDDAVVPPPSKPGYAQ
jgi:hypothetical protein